MEFDRKDFGLEGLLRGRQLWTCWVARGLLGTFVGTSIVGINVTFRPGVFDLQVVLCRRQLLTLEVTRGFVRAFVVSRLIVFLFVGRVLWTIFAFVGFIIVGLFQTNLETPVDFVKSIEANCFGLVVLYHPLSFHINLVGF